MAAVPQIIRQHLIDPELCARCNSCEEACPRQAITHDYQNYAVDPDLCGACRTCIDTCSTGAIDNWRSVACTDAYSVAAQLTWLTLPNPIQLPGESDFETEPATAALCAAPPSAAKPVTHLFGLHSPAMARVVGNRQLTASSTQSDLHHVVLDFGRTEFPVLEGQSLSIVPPGTNEHGHPHHLRVYSVASPRDGEMPGTNTVALTIKRVTENYEGQPTRGVCSNYLCDLEVGDSVQVVGPSGATFLMPDEPGAALLMICTGTGIAPMRGIIERRRRLGRIADGPMMLFYGGRTPQEMAYYDELAALPAELLDAMFALSRTIDQPRMYVQDLLRRHSDAVAELIMRRHGYIYVCGLRGMEAGVNEALHDILGSHGHDWTALLPELQRSGRYHQEVY